jgi:ATP-dependent DNA helicase RecQ
MLVNVTGVQSGFDVHSALKRFFGYDSFRPHQLEIITDALAGRDTFALLPTGGGKSLCFQLPAVLRSGLTVVVSPLIALMKDQVDQLTASGIFATCLNSSLPAGEARARLRGLHEGSFKLLYVAPERLMLSGFLEDLNKWNVSLFAIDEAHCISEWGHDFRPEYRQIPQLRDHFPDVPFMACTATATDRVRSDIVESLRLREPGIHIGSFNRENLLYRVVPRESAYDQIVRFLRERPNESGIIYCQSRKSTESLASELAADKFLALPYHAGLSNEERARNQDSFLRDETKIICATIAFGLGINKSNVRFVIHRDLPKNIEGYYQETGRAGRDGLPSECVLLFNAGDVVKHGIFIDQKPEPEKSIARRQLNEIVHFAESTECRRAQLLRYFSEIFPHDNCGDCDNCLAPREMYDATLPAQKILSCVYRIRERSGFFMGLNHVVDVLIGGNKEKIRQFQHDQLSTYGIGKDLPREQWQLIGRELIRLGLLRQNAERMNVIELTEEGRAALKERRSIQLTKQLEIKKAAKERSGFIECDEALFDELRSVRMSVATERGVPAYVIFQDTALRHMAREYPTSFEEFASIPGVGARKVQDFAEKFTAEIRNYLATHNKQSFAPASARPVAPPPPARKTESVRDTLRLFREGKTISEIATARGFVESTIEGHLVQAIAAGEKIDLRQVVSAEGEKEIREALSKCPGQFIAPVRALLNDKYSYGEIRLVAAMSGRSAG